MTREDAETATVTGAVPVRAALETVIARTASAARWLLGFAVIAGLYYGAHLLPLSSRIALILNQSAFSLPFAMSVVGSLLAARVVAPPERRFWTLLALGNTLLLLAEVFYSAYMIFVNAAGPPVPSAFEVLNLTGAACFFALLLSMTKLRTRTPVVCLRFVADVFGVVTVCTVATYVLWVTPLFDAHHMAAPAVRVLAAIYPIIGVMMLAGTLGNIVGFKVTRWQVWEKQIAFALGIFSAGLIMWPLSAVNAQPGSSASIFDVMYLGGEYLLFMATVSRLTAPEGARLRPLPSPLALAGPRGVWVSLVVPGAMLAGIPLLVYGARTAPEGSMGSLFGVAALALAALVVVRTALVAMENGQLLARSVTDPLTGLFNHRRFHEHLASEIEVAGRYDDPLSVAVLDIDDFSVVNNLHGHTVGDMLLQRAAAAVSRACDGRGMVCRIGGDEFGVILPETGAEEGYDLCRRMLASVRDACSEWGWEVTASVGLASYPEDGTDREDLVRKAAGAQYWGKYHGKGQVVRYDVDVVESLGAEERIHRLEEHARVETVRALAAAADARDAGTQDHSRNVADLAVALGAELGFDEERVRTLEMAALLHDIGKIGISDGVLGKPGPLTADERLHMEHHAELGERILSAAGLDGIVGWAAAHHERWDGTGYPRGLAAEEIPLEARILAVCDAFDAMTSDRPYREARSTEDALQEVLDFAGRQFDPDIVDVFVALIARRLLD